MASFNGRERELHHSTQTTIKKCPLESLLLIVKKMVRNTKWAIFLRFRSLTVVVEVATNAARLTIKNADYLRWKATKPNSMSVPGFCNASACSRYII